MKDYKYKFTIIMSIYNVEEYLEDAIKSVINQTIGFKKNVQLILVNDGSPDNSEGICLKYRAKYSDNIEYYKKENGGLSSARNLGLNYRKGKYVNFLDPDDMLSRNTLKEVYRFFEKYYNKIEFVSIPLWFFEAKEGLHFKYKFLGNKNKIINLKESPYNFILSSAASFYKTSVFNDRKYNENLSHAEDLALNMELYWDNPSFGYVCEDVKYNYRQRYDESSIVSSGKNKPETYHTINILFKDLINDKKHNNIFKEIVVYQLKNVLKTFNKEIFDSLNEYNQLKKQYVNFIEAIGLDYIINESFWAKTTEEKLSFIDVALPKNKLAISNKGFLSIKNTNLDIKYIPNIRTRIQDITVQSNYINIEMTTNSFDGININYYAKDNSGKMYEPIEKEVIDSRFNIEYHGKEISKTLNMKFSIPIKKITNFSFYFMNCDKEYKLQNYWINNNTFISLKHNNMGKHYKKKLITFNNQKKLFIVNNTGTYLRYKIISTLRLLKKYRKIVILRLLSLKNKKYILFSERPNKAGDNSEALFKYVSTLNYENKDKVYFAIDKRSKDYNKLKKYGKVIPKNSLKHKFIYLNAKVLVSSHLHPLFYKPFENISVDVYYRDLLDYKFVWLQHGVTINDVSKPANRYSQNYNKIVTSTVAERGEVLTPSYFLNYDNTILTGLPRFDFLNDNSQNIITIIPTWRRDLTGRIKFDGTHEPLEGFTKSLYFESYNNLLTDDKLIKKISDENLKINFILHPGMVIYEEIFSKFQSNNINIISANNVNYSKIFQESKLLITDYSSVFFDFSYLKKPTIYFQFDQEEFFTNHYKKGYFSYEEHGFGDVLTTTNEVIDKIEYYIDNNFEVEKKYLDRINNTFAYTDKNNSKRVWNEIMKLYNKEEE